jgi:hypothetical protein
MEILKNTVDAVDRTKCSRVLLDTTKLGPLRTLLSAHSPIVN